MEETFVNPQTSMVLIVGAGPTGLTAALELSRLQIPVRLVEKMAEPATTSRAVGVQARTLELFEQRGLIQPMLEKGNPALAACFYGQGQRIFRLEFSHNRSDYGYVFFISQAETEAILRNALEKQGVAIEREVEFVAFAQADRDRGDAVKAILKHPDGSLEDFNCAYLIDTEGAHSVCRTTLNHQFKGKTLHETYVTWDLYVEGDLSETEFHIFSSEFGLLALFPLGRHRFRLVASNPLSAPSKDTAPSLEEVQTIYNQRAHIPARLHDISWSSWFGVNSRMVDRLRIGRAFFGGDSAHIHSPAGGQGMNTGIQDMINLAWKLAFVLKGQADPKLLDTYTEDRIPVIRDVLTRTESLTYIAGSPYRFFRSAFNTVAPWVTSMGFIQENATTAISQVAFNYRHSPLSVSHGKSSDRSLKSGDRVPNVRVLTIAREPSHESQSKSESLFSVLNKDRFVLLLAGLADAEATHRSVQSSLVTWMPLMQTFNLAPAPGQEQQFRRVFGSHSSLILVRPDGYVAFSGTEQSVEALAQYLSSWFPIRKKSN